MGEMLESIDYWLLREPQRPESVREYGTEYEMMLKQILRREKGFKEYPDIVNRNRIRYEVDRLWGEKIYQFRSRVEYGKLLQADVWINKNTGKKDKKIGEFSAHVKLEKIGRKELVSMYWYRESNRELEVLVGEGLRQQRNWAIYSKEAEEFEAGELNRHAGYYLREIVNIFGDSYRVN